jgi:hypothetical protein
MVYDPEMVPLPTTPEGPVRALTTLSRVKLELATGPPQAGRGLCAPCRGQSVTVLPGIIRLTHDTLQSPGVKDAPLARLMALTYLTAGSSQPTKAARWWIAPRPVPTYHVITIYHP